MIQANDNFGNPVGDPVESGFSALNNCLMLVKVYSPTLDGPLDA